MLYSIRIPWSEERAEESMARLAPFDVRGVTEGESEAEVFFASLAEARAAAALFGAAEPAAAAEANWSEAYQQTWQPTPVGDKFFLVPEWLDAEVPPGRIPLSMIGGNVFGGGDHATTQLCLMILESIVRPGMRVADIGAGTAILARAARALGAQAVACDIDPNAAPYVDFIGSAEALATRTFHVVIANIHLRVLEDIREDLLRISRESGRILLSGFLPEQRPAIRALFGHEVAAAGAGGWCAALFAR